MRQLGLAESVPGGRLFPLNVPQAHIPDGIVEPVSNEQSTLATNIFGKLLDVLTMVLFAQSLRSEWAPLWPILLQPLDDCDVFKIDLEG